MAITEAQIREQLPPGAQKSGSGKEIAGVIDENLQGDQDVLANQARMMARARGGIAYEAGAQFSDEFVRRNVINTPASMIERSMSEETILALQEGQLKRDQQYVGSNADWTGYYLEPLAKFIMPFDTPFRNMLPRVSGPGIDYINWRAITSVFNGSGPSVGNFILQQQGTPQKAQYVWANFSNLLRTLSFSDIVTDESEIYGRMFEPDVRAKVAAKLAPSLMLGQEVWYLNASQKLWAPPPVNGVSTSASGGSVTAATYWIVVTAVNANGETLATGGSTPVAVSITTTGSTSTITFNIMRVPNAVSYNVYMGTGSTQPANSALFQQVATKFGGASALNDPGGLAQGWFTVTMTAAAATSGTAYSSVVSAGNTAVAFPSANAPVGQALTFDGIQSLIYLNSSNNLSTVGEGGETAVVKRVADANGVLAKSDIDNWLESMYFNARANPECLLVGIKDHKAISNIVMNATSFRINTQATQQGLSDLVGGGRATKWLNQTTGRLIDIVMCPYLMQGTIIACSLTLPFQVAEIIDPPLCVNVNREMWAREYPPDQSHMTQWQYASFVNETLKCQYLGGQGLLTGIVTA